MPAGVGDWGNGMSWGKEGLWKKNFVTHWGWGQRGEGKPQQVSCYRDDGGIGTARAEGGRRRGEDRRGLPVSLAGLALMGHAGIGEQS